jgi:endonuclease/exonuclease/phosphatase family metal-dependent hydrolase
VRVLTWNLFHGRAVPDRPRSLLHEFAATLAGWEWDVALLQEVPPWWPPILGRACRASARMALTSRNLVAPPRRWIAGRRPDLIKSNGGGANAILVRGARIAEHRRRTLSRRPERRVLHAVRLDDGTWVANLHAQGPDDLAHNDLMTAARTTVEWSGPAPAVLGGDLNLRRPEIPGFTVVAGRHVDHIAVRGLTAAGPPSFPDHDRLSDHDAVLVALRKESPPPRV